MAINIIIAGDVVPSDRTLPLFKERKTEFLFGEVMPVLKEADYAVVNCEAPVVIDEGNPIKKSGPNLAAPPQAVEVIKEAGFNMITLANNHFRDQGQTGVMDTLHSAVNVGLDYVGGGENLAEAQKTKYVTIKDKKFAFLNFCEQEYSIATEKYGGSNPYDIINITRLIQEAKATADDVILIIHGGIEHYPLPSPRMKKEYRFFVDAGADAVINHHQHCFSGYEVYKGKPICYGLGNFCFDMPKYRNNGLWDKGYLAKLTIDEGQISLSRIPYSQCFEEPRVRLLEESAFEEKLSELNAIISDEVQLLTSYQNLVAKEQKKMLTLMNVFGNKVFDKLYKMGYLGGLYKKSRLYVAKDLLTCESHYDILKNSMNNMVEES